MEEPFTSTTVVNVFSIRYVEMIVAQHQVVIRLDSLRTQV